MLASSTTIDAPFLWTDLETLTLFSSATSSSRVIECSIAYLDSPIFSLFSACKFSSSLILSSIIYKFSSILFFSSSLLSLVNKYSCFALSYSRSSSISEVDLNLAGFIPFWLKGYSWYLFRASSLNDLINYSYSSTNSKHSMLHPIFFFNISCSSWIAFCCI